MAFLTPRKPLPPNVRLFNRTLLFLLIGFLLYQCGTHFWGFPTPNTEELPTATEPLPPEPSAPDSLVGDSMAFMEDDPDSTSGVSDTIETKSSPYPPHIAAQKDPGLAKRIDGLLRAYKPDHALILLVNPQNNEILAWGQRTDSTISTEPTFLKRSEFPAASLIKMVTAAAALETKQYALHTELPMIGRHHTLYKRQLNPPQPYQGPTISVLDAFAKSSNPALGLIGLRLGGRALGQVAYQMGFNRLFRSDIPHMSIFIPPDTGYGLAEAACGFTQANTISPLHAAGLIRALLKKQPLAMPWSQNMPADTFTYQQNTFIPGTTLSENTYYGMRQMLLRTVTEGTSRKAMYKTLFSYNRSGFEIGGKTGSLDGTNPKGRYDWFAGFAQYKKDASQGLVLVVMQVHGKYRSQSSSTVAAQIINYWAKYNVKSNP